MFSLHFPPSRLPSVVYVASFPRPLHVAASASFIFLILLGHMFLRCCLSLASFSCCGPSLTPPANSPIYTFLFAKPSFLLYNIFPLCRPFQVPLPKIVYLAVLQRVASCLLRRSFSSVTVWVVYALAFIYDFDVTRYIKESAVNYWQRQRYTAVSPSWLPPRLIWVSMTSHLF